MLGFGVSGRGILREREVGLMQKLEFPLGVFSVSIELEIKSYRHVSYPNTRWMVVVYSPGAIFAPDLALPPHLI